MEHTLLSELFSAVDDAFEDQVEFTKEIVSHASLRGKETSAQDCMADVLASRDFEVDRWQIDFNDIRDLPGFSPLKGAYDDAVNVVGKKSPQEVKGASLILNGHIDVVPEGPLDMWDFPPYQPHVKDGWLYGRGAGDMKAGLVANLYALDAISALGFKPAAEVFFQSVVEEECTGNGALACLQRGYKADAVLIPEPFEERLTTAQVGVLWFQVHFKGIAMHVAYSAPGANSIESMVPVIAALREMELEWNKPHRRHHAYCDHDHALNLNIGKVAGGDWVSSVPAWSVMDVRMGLFPGQDIETAKREIEATIAAISGDHPFLSNNPPEIIYEGFQAEGYALIDDDSTKAKNAISALGDAHLEVVGTEMSYYSATATTDARFFGLYADTPALVYGPTAEGIHGFNERVDLESVKRVTKTTALFIANWCGLEKV